MADTVLDVRNLSKAFGALRVLDEVSLRVSAGEIVGLLGPNGSGKSTLLNVVSGFYDADGGRVALCGTDLAGLRMHERARKGFVRTFQLPSMPSRLTAFEVLLAGSVSYSDVGSALFRTKRQKLVAAEARKEAERLLNHFRLAAVRDLPASSLSGGQKKLLSIATAMMLRPKLLGLDEPTAGVHPNLRREMVDLLRKCRDQGTSILVIEHDMRFVADLCDRCVVLDRGKVIADCHPSELSRDERVVSAYLGHGSGRVEAAE